MTIPFRQPAPNVGRFTTLILGLVALACVAMIGGTGYLKYRLDRAETLLGAPDSAVGSDQDSFDRLRRVLGYGGFLGLAQNYATKHDTAGFAEMKADIKAADEIVAHLPERTPAETRHDLAAIVSAFDTALQRVNAPAGDNSDFTITDLVPLYAALPILDARVSSTNAGTRLGAENEMHFWGMMLTLVSWCSLIIAAACAAAIYFTLRDKHSAPMKALAQSIQNMARGDMRTAIWGTERQDQIGELARAVDIARYHFSHLPDLSLLSDQGPVRMRFEGGTRSLFEAMMKAISGDSENIRNVSTSLTREVQDQRESIAELSKKVESVLNNIVQQGQNGDRQITQAISEMVTSAENLKNAHGHAADQLNRLIPHMHDRANGMAEIAQIAGKQVAQTLQALTVSEMGLKANADQAKETLTKLSSTADDLGERLFGAINLLQASGKVLAETTEGIQHGRYGGEPVLPAVSTANVINVDSAAILNPMVSRLEQIAGQLIHMQDKMGQPVPMPAIFQPAPVPVNVDRTHDLSLLSGFQQLIAERVEPKFNDLAAMMSQQARAVIENGMANAAQAHNALADMTQKISTLVAGLPADLRQGLQSEWQRLSTQLDAAQVSLAQRLEQHRREIKDHGSNLSLQTRDSVIGLGDRLTSLAIALPVELRQNLHEDIENLSAKIDAASKAADPTIGDKVASIAMAVESARTDAAATREVAQAALAGLEKQIQGSWFQMAAQIEASRASLDKALKEQVADKMGAFEQVLAATRAMVEALREETVRSMQPAPFVMPPELKKQLQDQWFQVAGQIEASRSSLVETISQQLVKMENRIGGEPSALSRTASDYATQRQIEQQTQILGELVGALAALDTHMQQIQSEIHTAAR